MQMMNFDVATAIASHIAPSRSYLKQQESEQKKESIAQSSTTEQQLRLSNMSNVQLQMGEFSRIGRSHEDRTNPTPNEDRTKFGVFNSLFQRQGSLLLNANANLHDSESELSRFSTGNRGCVLDGFAAVFDGHGGHACSDYVSNCVERHLRGKFVDEDSWLNGERVMMDMFREIDNEYRKYINNLRPKDEMAYRQGYNAGSCATIAVFKDNEVIIGNIGDCGAMIVPIDEKGQYMAAQAVTVDHRADSTAELLRIKEQGGKVDENGRILSLQPSRSFGDFDVKDAVKKPLVVSEPDTDKICVQNLSRSSKAKTRVKRSELATGSDRPFMVIASDGVWDTLKNVEDVAKVVKSGIKRQLKKQKRNSKSLNGIAQAVSGMRKLGFMSGSARPVTIDEMNLPQQIEAINCQELAQEVVNAARNAGSDDDISAVVIIF